MNETMKNLKLTPAVMLNFYRNQANTPEHRELIREFRNLLEPDQLELLFHMVMLLATDIRKLQANSDPFADVLRNLRK